MRRPAQPHPTPAAAWAHPYTGAAALAVFYNDGGNPVPDPKPADPPKPTPPPEPTVTMSQDELNALAAKEKDQGKRAGARAALEEFAAEHGFTTLGDAKVFIAAARKAQEDALSEQEKRERELADREARAEAREQAALARERAAARRAVLAGLGATGDDLEDAAALLRVNEDADETTIADTAAKLKERRPELFGATTTAPGTVLPPAPSGAPAGGPSPRTPAAKTSAKDRARQLAISKGYAKPDAA